MLALLLALNGLATPLGSPVASPSHGTLRLSAAVSGERAPSEARTFIPTVRTPQETLRLDWVLLDGLGLWADGSYRSAVVSGSSYRAHGWCAGGGARGHIRLMGPLALGLQGRGSYGLDWTRTEDGEIDGWYRRVALRGAASLVLGPRDGGAYAWVGARATAWAVDELDVASEGMRWDLDRDHLVGMILGGELHSRDLVGHGLPGTAYLSLGLEVHLIDVTGAGLWVGLAR